jgi:hypothetical protein
MSGFIRVDVVYRRRGRPAHGRWVEIDFGSGLRLRFGPGVDAEILSQLFTVLKRHRRSRC